MPNSKQRLSPRAELLILSFVLVGAAVALMFYRISEYGMPLLPVSNQPVWAIGVEVRFDPIRRAPGNRSTATKNDAPTRGGVATEANLQPIKVSLALPPRQNIGANIFEEESVAPGYGFHLGETANARRAIWTRRDPGREPQHLFYSMLVSALSDSDKAAVESPLRITPPVLEADERSSIQGLIDLARRRSSDRTSLVQQLLVALDEEAGLREGEPGIVPSEKATKVETAVRVLLSAGIPARMARILPLDEEQASRSLVEWLDVVVDGHWRLVNPEDGSFGIPVGAMVWKRGGSSLLDVEGGRRSSARFTVVRHALPAAVVSRGIAGDRNTSNPIFSIQQVPHRQQKLFKMLLLIPLAALAIVFMRNLVGVLTSGTFLPLLLSLAFLETGLLPGIAMFVLIVAAGMLLRGYLSHLNLLLVARISAALIIVVFLMVLFSVISWRIGWFQGLKISVFPLVIIAWTIERLAITIEEEGPRDALLELGGTLLVSAVCFGIVSNRWAEHVVFNFPESNIIVLVLTLWLGTYSGYRLTELYRFRHLDSASRISVTDASSHKT